MDRPLTLLLIGVLGLVAGCGGGSSPATEGSGSTNLVAAFTADEPNPGADTVALARASSSGSLLTLAVNVTDTTGVYGAGFDLLYDANKVTFVNWSAGSLLEQGGHSPFYQVDASQAGRLVVVATRLGDVPAVDATGSMPLIRLIFRATEAGTSNVSFAGTPELRDAQDPQQQLPVNGWFGGTLSAN